MCVVWDNSMSNILYAWYDTEATEALELFSKKNYCKESDSVSDSTELFSHQGLLTTAEIHGSVLLHVVSFFKLWLGRKARFALSCYLNRQLLISNKFKNIKS